ncbi:hypothetical protein [Iningainema tapete]|uniref:Uncharacterized protein n=1 Tax=Iningainema tapete BLCC-T55 TaxID=2748662 RepID=A0A8J6XPG0_9CYAN|nr:hypothetical protein [Iningainema tapete]MBD2775705.1 hypothetical protein [Iningainema tapete BLCC-T55]
MISRLSGRGIGNYPIAILDGLAWLDKLWQMQVNLDETLACSSNFLKLCQIS